MKSYLYDAPQLSGKLWYATPNYWRIKQDQESFEILAARTPRGLILYFIVLALLSVAVSIGIAFLVPSADKFKVIVGGIGIALALVVAAEFIRVTFANEQGRGPILIWSLSTKQIRLPRAGASFATDRILRWEIVHGTQVTDAYGKSSRFPEVISEVQMLVDDGQGQIVAWPIIGAMGHFDSDLFQVAADLARITSLPCDVVKATTNPTKQNRHRIH